MSFPCLYPSEVPYCSAGKDQWDGLSPYNRFIIFVIFLHVHTTLFIFFLHWVFIAAHKLSLVAVSGFIACGLCCFAAFGIFLDQGSHLSPLH